ncbi:MAG: hypothetical protein JXA04_00780 [Gammaproteobacteria bacterium]|nr:hypothetical protein [Gammaproteobacteria bacterium]
MIATIGLWVPKTIHAPPLPVVFYIQSYCDIDVKYAEKMLKLYDLQRIQTHEFDDIKAAKEFALRSYGLKACEFRKFQMEGERTGTYQYNDEKGEITKPKK